MVGRLAFLFLLAGPALAGPASAFVVDKEAEAKFFENEYVTGCRAKLVLMMALASERGWAVDETDDHVRHRRVTISGKTGRPIWEATIIPSVRQRWSFVWFGPGGKQVVRSEGGYETVSAWSWWRPDGSLIRNERARINTGNRPATWTWYDKKSKVVRVEHDSDGDGIPDRLGSGEDTSPLPPGKSWAVHPKLIPRAQRIPDQPGRRVPVKKPGKKEK